MYQPHQQPAWRSSVNASLKETQTLLRKMGAPASSSTASGVDRCTAAKQGHHQRADYHYDPPPAGGAGIGVNGGSGGGGSSPHIGTGATLAQQLKSLVAELDMERVGRKEADRNMNELMTIEFARLGDAVHHLKSDNALMKQQLTEVQRRPTGVHVEGPTTIVGSGADQHHHHHGDTVIGAGTLIERVVALEELVARQQALLDDRSLRVVSAVQDAVNSKIDVEIEKMRSVARESAKTTCEDILGLRLTTLSGAFGKQVLEVEQACAAVTSRNEELTRLSMQLEEKQRLLQHDVDLLRGTQLDTGRIAADLKEEIVKEAAHKVDLERQKMEAAVSQLRGDISSQLRKSSSESLQSQQSLQQYIAQRMDTLSAQGVLRDEVQRMISQATGAAEGEVAAIVRSQTAMKQMTDELRNDYSRRIGTIENKLHEVSDGVQTMQNKESGQGSKLQRVAQDMEEMRSKVSAATAEVEALRETMTDTRSIVETHRLQTDQAISTTVRLEQEVATSVTRAVAALKAAEIAETKTTSIAARIDQEVADRSRSASTMNETLNQLQKSQKQAAASITVLEETTLSVASSTKAMSDVDSTAFAGMKLSLSTLEKKVAEQADTTAEQQRLSDAVEELSVKMDTNVKNGLKQLESRVGERQHALEVRVDEVVETVSNDRRRDYEQMAVRLQDTVRKVQDVRGEVEDQARRTADVLAHSNELHTSLQRTIAEKAGRSTVTEVEQRLAAVEALGTRMDNAEEYLDRLRDVPSRIAALSDTSVRKESPTPRDVAAATAGQFGARDARRLIDDYFATSISPALDTLREDCTDAATQAHRAEQSAAKTVQVQSQQADTLARVSSRVEEMATLVSSTAADVKKMPEVKSAAPAAAAGPTLDEEEIHQRIDNAADVIDGMQQQLNEVSALVTTHTSYFDEVRDRVEELFSTSTTAVDVVRQFVSDYLANAHAGDEEMASRLLPPETLADAMQCLTEAVGENDRKLQVSLAQVINILRAHSNLLPQIVDVSNTYSSFFQLFATHCGLEPSDFVVELTASSDVRTDDDEEDMGMGMGMMAAGEEEELAAAA